MPDSPEAEEIVSRIHDLAISLPAPAPEPSSTAPLNSRLREYLSYFASTLGHGFSQDNVGNTYIVRPGSDSSLSAIAIAFPMDALSTMPSFSGAFNTFLSLQKLDTKCAITLLGWSSPGGSTIGQEVWEGDRTATEGYERFPELEQFKGGEEARGFSLSAIFEVLESAAGSDAPLTVRGSAVLTEATRRAATAHASSAGNKAVTVESGGYVSKRVPFVTIQGTDAGTLARVTIERYSEYVAALFENFD